jgi:uncharacterized phage infection (PIP) family protein YhgE
MNEQFTNYNLEFLIKTIQNLSNEVNKLNELVHNSREEILLLKSFFIRDSSNKSKPRKSREEIRKEKMIDIKARFLKAKV